MPQIYKPRHLNVIEVMNVNSKTDSKANIVSPA